ncbi:MAG: hypothetical protein R3C60_01920 [Parvularculaceae bacterium]
MTDISSYQQRNFRFSGIWQVGGIALKIYLINRHDDPAAQTDLLSLAKIYTATNLPSIAAVEGNDHGVGYSILHAGEMSNWLLVHWWAYGDIALRLLASCDHGQIEFRSQDHRRFHACVWEHVVIDHERDAWVRHMSRDDRTAEQYLEDRLPNGQY